MSKRRSLRDRIKLFIDLRDVLDAMKTFALVEIGKLTRTQYYRHHLLEELLDAARRSAAYQPDAALPTRRLYVILGSERGLCADFNERIVTVWKEIRGADPGADFIVVGSALAAKLAGDAPLAVLTGPLGAEDIEGVLLELVRHIGGWQGAHREAGSISVVAGDGERVSSDIVLPLAWPKRAVERPPTLNLAPETFIRHFIDYYVDAKLHDAFATSLLAENHARAQHMTAALGKLDEDLANLERRARRLRQEEITQEVETILLAVDSGKEPTTLR